MFSFLKGGISYASLLAIFNLIAHLVGLTSAMGDTESINYHYVEESMFPTETHIAMMEEGPCSASLKYVGRFAYLRKSKAATLCGLEKKPITPKRIIH